ncbi:MAG: energy transducer TonB [Prevotella sp.]|nr:energy transducer TonB [Prevotella sp.]
MKRGKKICQTLKDIRLQVARTNDIPYEPTECKHKGDCPGTCPKCEQEVRYIEQQLNVRRMMGKAVAVAGVSVGLTALTACNISTQKNTLKGEMPIQNDTVIHPTLTMEIKGELPIQNDTVIHQKSEYKEEAKSMIVKGDTISEEFIVGEIMEERPSFPGGQQKLMEFIANNIRYTDEMKETGITGRVVVSVVIKKDGSIGEPKIIRSIHPLFDNEALRVISSMPKWRPGSQRGKRVEVTYSIPILFKE